VIEFIGSSPPSFDLGQFLGALEMLRKSTSRKACPEMIGYKASFLPNVWGNFHPFPRILNLDLFGEHFVEEILI